MCTLVDTCPREHADIPSSIHFFQMVAGMLPVDIFNEGKGGIHETFIFFTAKRT